MATFKLGEPDFMKYDSITFPGYITADAIDRLQKYTFDPSDILVASFPKSGTNWIATVTALILSGGKESKDFFGNIEYTFTLHSTSKLDIKKSPGHYYTHLPFHFLEDCFTRSRPKVICIMRNPFDQLVSYYYFYKTYKPFGQFTGSWDEFYNELYKKNKLFYGSYFDHVAGWWDAREEHKDHILFIKYEDMLKDPLAIVIQVASFLGKELSQDAISSVLEKSSFKNMQKNPELIMAFHALDMNTNAYLRKGIAGDWKNIFNEKQEQEIAKMYLEKIVGRGLNFDLEIPAKPL